MQPRDARVRDRDAYIFDLDGTLVDTSPIHARAFAAVLAPRGIAVDYARIAGCTTPAAIDLLVGEAGQTVTAAERAALIDAKQAHARAAIAAGVSLLPGAQAMLDAVADRPCALWTAASRATAQATLAGAGLAGRFAIVVAAEAPYPPKPDPAGLNAILAALGVTASRAILFEDAEPGLAAARAIGMPTLRIGDGGTDWAAVREALR